eukprot:TRINITY_DN28093_c0_g1_i2.p2 TRINITY_DN28093_c0_g1~~TRINITY_DN28093_c0_g1_i2.p2  ORF type:complete len:225 (-),score=55.79 TRINITY_DN28093_c0_g1_i2:185-859(-)
MKLSVFTSPENIVLPHIDDAGPSWVELKWSPPRQLGRSLPLHGYRIALCAAASAAGDGRWHILSDCTAADTCAFAVTGLVPGARYLVEIRALNDAGLGEASELEVEAAAVIFDDASQNDDVSDGKEQDFLGVDGAGSASEGLPPAPLSEAAPVAAPAALPHERMPAPLAPMEASAALQATAPGATPEPLLDARAAARAAAQPATRSRAPRKSMTPPAHESRIAM